MFISITVIVVLVVVILKIDSVISSAIWEWNFVKAHVCTSTEILKPVLINSTFH